VKTKSSAGKIKRPKHKRKRKKIKERERVSIKREITKSRELNCKTETIAHGKAPLSEDFNQSLLWCRILARS
jgi:hypothetical protein